MPAQDGRAKGERGQRQSEGSLPEAVPGVHLKRLFQFIDPHHSVVAVPRKSKASGRRKAGCTRTMAHEIPVDTLSAALLS
jgi:hypothetical protein